MKWYTIQISNEHIVEFVGTALQKDIVLEAFNNKGLEASIEIESPEEFDDYSIVLDTWNIKDA